MSVRARRPALWVWLDLPGADARFSDNFVPVAPDEPITFKVTLTNIMTRDEITRRLRVRSLFDKLQ